MEATDTNVRKIKLANNYRVKTHVPMTTFFSLLFWPFDNHVSSYKHLRDIRLHSVATFDHTHKQGKMQFKAHESRAPN